jgi:ATP/maltotriose-dependent transcriptional regulator MalT
MSSLKQTRELTLVGTRAIRRAIARARSALITMRLEEASKATRQLRRLLSDHENRRCDRYLCALRTLEASLHTAADHLTAARIALMAHPALQSDPIAAVLLRYLDWKRGDLDEKRTPDSVDYLVAPVGGRAVARILSLSVSAALAFDRLHLTVSFSLATEAFQLARDRYGTLSAISSFPATLLAQVAYEQGRLEEAEALLRPRVSVMRASGTLECVARASVLLARLALHRGQRRAALAMLHEAEALGQTRRWPRLSFIASTEYNRALTIIQSEEAGPCENHRKLAMACRERPLPLGLEGPCCDDSHSISAFETSLGYACSAAAAGRMDDSYALLIHCLHIGAARGLRMIFVDSGRPCLSLLERLYESLATTDHRIAHLRPYVSTLLRVAAPASSDDGEPPTYRPLSRRETDILRMIARGQSNKRIAQSLEIAPETVKSHAKGIFVKLDARTRAQAVARGESIGLL